MGIFCGFWQHLTEAFSEALHGTEGKGCVVARFWLLFILAVLVVSSSYAQTVGTRYKVTRVGRDVLGGQGYYQSQDIFAVSPDGRYATGVRFGATTRGFLMTTPGTPSVIDLPKINATRPYAYGKDVNDLGDVVGYEKWTVGNVVNIIPWLYRRSSNSVSALSSTQTVLAMPTAITANSTHAFGMIDQDGLIGPILSQGVVWNLSTLARTVIPGTREILDASSDGSILLVLDTDGKGKILRGSTAAGWTTTVTSFGFIKKGKVSPNGRYVGTSEIGGDCVMRPLVFDTQLNTRTNLPLRPTDTLGGIVGGVSDTGSVIGSIHTAGSNGSYAVNWRTPETAYTPFSDILTADGHVALDPAYNQWNLYNGGDGISADGQTIAIYGTNISVLEDSMLFQQNCPAITISPTSSSLGTTTVGINVSQAFTSSGGTAPYIYETSAGSLPPGTTLNPATGVITGRPSAAGSYSFTVRGSDANGCTGSRAYTVTINAATSDFGDYSGFGSASSTVSTTLFMGSLVDAEGEAITNATATGDDEFDQADEDGVTFTPLIRGQSASITVRLTNKRGGTSYLNAWIDWNNDGVLSTTERIAANLTVANNTVDANRVVTFTVPATAVEGPVGARIRLTSTSNPAATGASGVGEVEDYVVNVLSASTDYGDYASFGVAGSALSSNLRMGTNPTDAENSGVANSTATGDNDTGTNDEDIQLPEFTVGGSSPVSFSVLNSSGANAYLTAWADWNNDGQLTENERVIPETTISSASSAQTRTFSISVPTSAVAGRAVGLRFRLSSQASIPSTGIYGSGEVEDYLITPQCPVITLSPASLSAASRGVAYSQTFSASGGTAPYTYTVSAGALPTWASLNSNTGVLSGTPNSSVSTTFTIRATDASGCLVVRTYNLAVSCSTLSFSPSSLPQATVGTTYSQTLTASGGTAPYTWTISSGSLPTGLTLSSAGVISGVPSAASGGNIILRVADADGCSANRAYSIPAVCPVINISPATLAEARSGETYNQSLSSNLPYGLTGRYYTGANLDTLVITRPETSIGFNWGSGSPDASLPSDGFSARWDGTAIPPTTGSYTFRTTTDDGVRLWVNNQLVIDRWVDQGSTAYTATVSLTAGVPVAIRMEYFERAGEAQATLEWSGPSFAMKMLTEWVSYQWDIASGNLPQGLVLNPVTGLISGTITSPESANFTVRITDTNGCVGTRAYSLTPTCPTINISPTSLATVTAGSAYNQALTVDSAAGVKGEYYMGTNFGSLLVTRRDNAIDFDWGSGAPDPRMPSDNFSARWTGTVVPQTTGSYTFKSTSDDGFRLWVNGELVIDRWVDQGPTSYTATRTLTAGVAVSIRAEYYEAGGGAMARLLWSGPNMAEQPITQWQNYTWSVVSGTLPAGLSLNANTGVISGTPTSASSSTFTVRAADFSGCVGTHTYTLGTNCPTLSISPASLPNTTQNTSYSQTLTASGGTGTYTWSLSDSVLPTGLTLSNAGVISGTASATPGVYSFRVRAVDAAGCIVTRDYTLTILCPALTLTPASLANATQGTAYSQTLAATGGNGTYTYTYTLAAGNTLPTGLILSTAGVISGTPTAVPGNYTFTVQAVDAASCFVSRTYTLTILCRAITITPTTLNPAPVGAAYSQALTSTGGNGSYTYSITTGVLPDGISLSLAGVLSGTATTPTTANFTVQSRDATNCLGTRSYTLTTTCPSLTINPASLDAAYIGAAYSTTLTATSGTAPLTWSVSTGTLPTGLTLSAEGVLSGIPTAINSGSTFTVRVADANGCFTTRSYTLVVKGMAVGDLVYEDANFNGLRDSGEAGVANVAVQLWNAGADQAIGGIGSAADVQVGSEIITNAQGGYSFQNLPPGYYYVRITPPSSLPIPGGNPVNEDNGVDSDNNAVTQPGGAGTFIYSPVIQLSPGTEPTSEDGNADTDYTVDFGLYRGLSLGNLVWQDTNDNGLRDSGEPGVDGVNLEVWNTGADGLIGGTDDVRVRTTISSGGGAYSFPSLAPGKYYVRIPAPPLTHPLSSSSTVMADNGVDNDDNGHQVSGGAIYSPVVTLTAPAVGSNQYDKNTIDFGLCNVVPTAYVSATQDDSIQTYNASSGRYTGTLVHPFGNHHSQGDGDPDDVPYSMEMGPDGNWYVAHFGAGNIRRITPAGVDQGTVLQTAGTNITRVKHFTIGADGSFFVVDSLANRVVRFHGPLSSTPGQPIGTQAPYTFINQAGIQDLNIGPDGNLYLVLYDGALREVRRYSSITGAFLNVIVTDVQLINMVPGGLSTALISGIDIHGNTLYGINRSQGEVFRLDLSNPAVPGQPQLVATLSSAGKGDVDTRDIEMNPGDGKLYIAGYHWSKPVSGGSYATGALVRVDTAGAPAGTVDIFEAPIPTPPGPNKEIWSGPQDLAFGRPFSNLTDTVSIGSLVWNDTNNNGVRDSDENGIQSVKVELWRDTNNTLADGAETLIGWTFTDARGLYYFSGQVPGRYQVKIPVSNFESGGPLAGAGISSAVTNPNDDQTDNDDNGSQPNGARTETVSPFITLTPGAEPLGDGATGAEFGLGGDLDNYTADANGDMTVDFGFVEPGFMGIGNLVYNDQDGNGRYDLGEGVDGVTLQLYLWGQTPGLNLPIATTTTQNGGKYLFSGLSQGQFFVHIPASQFQGTAPLRGLFSLPGVQAGDDDKGEDSIDTATPEVNGLSTGRVVLTRNSAPTNSTTETGFAATDDDHDDSNIDLTVDFGVYRPVGLGNLVFMDNNTNGRYDPGEGVSGVTLQLYRADQQPGVSTPIATTVSGTSGRYMFDSILPGNYIVHIPKSMFAVGAPLYQRVSISEGLSGDDDVGEDGLNEGTPSIDGVRTEIISIYPGYAPTDSGGETGFEGTSDNDNDSAIDLTIDFGFQSPVGVGNLVFFDANGNGKADVGEGVNGVKVELYRADQIPGVSLPLYTQVTFDGGRYFFDYLHSGSYIVYIPASEFATGMPLAGKLSMPGAQTDASDDDLGEDGIDDANPALNGIRTRVITLNVDTAPTSATTEKGLYADMDSFDDNNFDLTIDFGFIATNPNAVGVGNLVFLDANGNGSYDAGEGVNGVKVQLFNASTDPQTGTPLASTVTANEGIYFFGNLVAGDYIVHIPKTEFVTGKPLFNWQSIVGQGGDNGIDDNADENGSDADPKIYGVSSTIINLSPGTEPVNSNGEFGRDAFMDDANDANADLTVDFGFSKQVAVGNLVFIDTNFNGRADEGEGVAGVEVFLFRDKANVLFDEPVGTATTNAGGRYLISNITPGKYFLHVPYYMFTTSGPLFQHVSMLGTQSGDDNLGEDGIDDPRPFSNGISTATFTLSATASPVGSAEGGLDGSSDDANDASVDLTRDFGFVPRVVIGNLVFADENDDGIFDPDSEYGLSGVTVELWTNAANATTALAATVTNNLGIYSFSVAPGSYHIRVGAAQFSSGGALVGRVPSAIAKPNNGATFIDDDVGQDAYTTGVVTAVGARTAAFTITRQNAPDESNGETGFLSYDDDGYDKDSDLTIDLGFAPVPVLNAMSQRMSQSLNGMANPEQISETDSASANTWQSLTKEIGAPGDDLDGDGAVNLVEYALGTDPASGLKIPYFTLQTDPVTNRVDALVTRPSGGRPDIFHQLETLSDLRSESWSPLSITPSVRQNNDGTETLRYSDVATLGSQGFLRVKINLDTDLNGRAEAVAVSSTQAWIRRDITGRQSFSMPLLLPEVFRGKNPSGIKTALQKNRSYYVEILSGPQTGQRYDLDEASTSDRALAFESTAPNLTDVIVAVRPHWTVDALFPADTFSSGTEASSADSLLFFDAKAGSFVTTWLSADGWTGSSNGSRVIAPGEGLLIHARHSTIPLTFTGTVRDTKLHLPILAGTQFIGSGFPVHHSLQTLGFSSASGFTAATLPEQATRLRLWNGDNDSAASSYRSLYLQSAPSVWLDESNLLDVGQQLLIEPTRAWFLISPTAQPSYKEP